MHHSKRLATERATPPVNLRGDLCDGGSPWRQRLLKSPGGRPVTPRLEALKSEWLVVENLYATRNPPR